MSQFAATVIADESAYEADEIRNPVNVTNCDTVSCGEGEMIIARQDFPHLASFRMETN